jgi:hypothetical protein
VEIKNGRMSSYILTQPNPQILAASEQLIIGVVWYFVVLVSTGLAVWKFRKVGDVVQLWAAMGTVTGVMATYFFTREQVKEQQAQARMFQAAYEASEKQKVDAGKQLWSVAAKIKPDAASPEIREAFGHLQGLAGDLFSRQVPAKSQKPEPTASPSDREFHDMLFRESPKPTP